MTDSKNEVITFDQIDKDLKDTGKKAMPVKKNRANSHSGHCYCRRHNHIGHSYHEETAQQ